VREEDGLFRRALLGLGLAAALWTFVFRSKRGNFWGRMALGAGTLGAYALRSRPELKEQRPGSRDVLAGAASAAGLYVIFQIGDRMARRIMPAGAEDIAEIYALRTQAPRPVITALLVTVIGPSEELFWRGLVEEAFIRRFGRFPGAAAAAAAYGGIHFITGNMTLTGAAGVAGAYWGAEYALRPRLGPLLVSHVLWDVWIFLLQPTPGAGESR
jgi:membrane protease YdiL (CAAX protease family)